MTNFESTDTYLEHFGKKGMRWGVRRDNRASNLKAVGKVGGKTTFGQKVRAYTQVGPITLSRSGGSFKKGAAIKGERSLALNKRVQSGKASAGDMINYYGGTRHADLIPSSRSRSSTKSAAGAGILGVVLVASGKYAYRNLKGK